MHNLWLGDYLRVIEPMEPDWSGLPGPSLAGRLRGLLEWSPVDKCLLGAFLVFTFVVWYTAVAAWLLADPRLAPYVNRSFLPVMMQLGVVAIAGWLSIIVVGLLLRRRRPRSSLFVHVTAQFFAVQAAFGSYVAGHHTSPLMGIVLLTAEAFGLLMFEPRQALGAIATLLAGIAGTTVAEQAGLIPYAPALASAPFDQGHLAASWLVGAGAVNFVGLLAMLGVIYLLINREHDRETRLSQTSDQLARAMDLISRYVAVQVAEQIRLGNYAALDRPERRRLTIFFSDIKDFSKIADEMEPEDLSRILNEYLSAMTEIAEHHGGTVDKFLGDAIMILFGAPVAISDREHALRGVRMAIEMQRRVAQLREQWAHEGFDETFHVRIGINTGVASVGNFGSSGRMDYTAIGRQVNLAARLQARCDPDRVLIGHSTWVLVSEEIPCVCKGEFEMKGMRSPVKAYELTWLRD